MIWYLYGICVICMCIEYIWHVCVCGVLLDVCVCMCVWVWRGGVCTCDLWYMVCMIQYLLHNHYVLLKF